MVLRINFDKEAELPWEGEYDAGERQREFKALTCPELTGSIVSYLFGEGIRKYTLVVSEEAKMQPVSAEAHLCLGWQDSARSSSLAATVSHREWLGFVEYSIALKTSNS